MMVWIGIYLRYGEFDRIVSIKGKVRGGFQYLGDFYGLTTFVIPLVIDSSLFTKRRLTIEIVLKIVCLGLMKRLKYTLIWLEVDVKRVVFFCLCSEIDIAMTCVLWFLTYLSINLLV